MSAEERNESRERCLLANHGGVPSAKRLANREIRDNRKWNVPTALSKRDALIHHFAHEGHFAAGRDHFNVGAGANLTGI